MSSPPLGRRRVYQGLFGLSGMALIDFVIFPMKIFSNEESKKMSRQKRQSLSPPSSPSHVDSTLKATHINSSPTTHSLINMVSLRTNVPWRRRAVNQD